MTTDETETVEVTPILGDPAELIALLNDIAERAETEED